MDRPNNTLGYVSDEEETLRKDGTIITKGPLTEADEEKRGLHHELEGIADYIPHYARIFIILVIAVVVAILAYKMCKKINTCGSFYDIANVYNNMKGNRITS